jgi:hypothetical protein
METSLHAQLCVVIMTDSNLPIRRFHQRNHDPVEIRTIPERFDAFENLLVRRSPFFILGLYGLLPRVSRIRPANVVDVHLHPASGGSGTMNEGE